jgi:hypothetical protein
VDKYANKLQISLVNVQGVTVGEPGASADAASGAGDKPSTAEGRVVMRVSGDSERIALLRKILKHRHLVCGLPGEARAGLIRRRDHQKRSRQSNWAGTA